MNRGLSLVGAAVTPPVDRAEAPTAIAIVVPTAAITFAPTAAADYVAAAASRTAVNAVGDAIGFTVGNAPTAITIVVAGNANTVPVHAFCSQTIVTEVVPDVTFTVGAWPVSQAKPSHLLLCAGHVVEVDVFRIVLFAVLIFVGIVIVFRLGGVIVLDRVIVVIFNFRVVIGRVDIGGVRGDGNSPEGLHDECRVKKLGVSIISAWQQAKEHSHCTEQ